MLWLLILWALLMTAYATRGPYLRWYWRQPITLTCDLCGTRYEKPRSSLPPRGYNWIAQCPDCAALDALRYGECPECHDPIAEGASHQHDGKPTYSWENVIRARRQVGP